MKTLLYNAAIYCSGRPDYTWMLFNRDTGYIEKVGRGQPWDELKSSATLIDGDGKRVLPGLQDAHLHLLSMGITLEGVQFKGSDSIEGFQRRIEEHVGANPDRQWYWGRHWEQDLLGRFPSREDVDAVCPDKPILLRRRCGHIAVVNSKALEIIGVKKDEPDPTGSQFDRFPEGHPKAGEPNGILRGKPLIRIFDKKFNGPATEEEKLQCIRTAMAHCLGKGVTCVHTLDPSCWSLYCGMADREELTVRTFYVDFLANADRDKLPQPGSAHGRLLYTDRLKLFADGSLGGSTAALSKPYNGTDKTGTLVHSQGDLNALVAEANGKGYRLEIHAIGDAAVDACLAAFEISRVAPEKRPIIAHCQVMRPDLITKMKRAGAIASIQPQFVPSDAEWAEKCLPKNLLELSYPWKTLMENGIPCAGGSDAPVETPEPLLGIYDAIFRPRGPQSLDGMEVFRPEEKLTIEQAIDLYTKGGAYAALREHCLGQLLPGYLADFVILDAPKDVVKHPECLLEAKVSQVWVDGKRRL